MAVALEQILKSRDERQLLQRRTLAENPGLTLMVLTVVMPGPEKRSELSLAAAGAAVEAVRRRFGHLLRRETLRDLETGFEGWFLLDLPPAEAKRAACEVEDTNPLGRLFDLDVFDPQTAAPISRRAAGEPERRCLLCDEPARVCMRAGTHTLPEILAKIRQMVTDYARGT